MAMGLVWLRRLYDVCQPPCFEFDLRTTQDLSRRTEIIPVKDSHDTPHTRIKSLALASLASGHGRYITVTPERALVSVGEWPLHIAVINL